MRAVQKRIIVVFLILLLFNISLILLEPQQSLAAAEYEIRVGLTEHYEGKEAITIKNVELGMGYCLDNVYRTETIFYSQSGITFLPVFEYFIDTGIKYSTYQEAKYNADLLSSLGYSAYPVCVYRDSWYVYVGGSSNYTTTQSLYEQIRNLNIYPWLNILGGNNYRLKAEGEFGSFLIDVDEHYVYPQFIATTVYQNDVKCIDLGTRVYRGRVEIGRYNKRTLTAVNIIQLEEYLYGVVPSEMPYFWNEEALKAQAVCSRSYAIVKAGIGGDSNAKKAYKLVDTTTSQVYKGYLAEKISTNTAVDMTNGKMVCYENKVVPAYFFSTSGGRTEASEDVWAISMPYLQSVVDIYETNPERKPWIITVSLKELEIRLKNQGSKIGTVNRLIPTRYTNTGRVHALNMIGSTGNITLQGSAIRTILGLYSTKFKLIRSTDIPDQVTVKGATQTNEICISDAYIRSANQTVKAPESLNQFIVKGADNLTNYPQITPSSKDTIMFAGMGYGHGVGMSQSGAKGMAEAGFTYQQIISYYFTGAQVQ